MIERDDYAKCPACNRALDPTPDDRRLICGHCRGGLVDEAALLESIAAVLPPGTDAPASLTFEPPTALEPFVTCPRCTARMTKHLLYGIQVDRCEAHGLWFDGGELQAVLEKTQAHAMPLEDKISLGISSAGIGVMLALQVVRFIWG